MASPDHDVSGRGGYVGPHRHLEDQADHLLFFCHLSSPVAKHYSHASWSLRRPCRICYSAPNICSALPELSAMGCSVTLGASFHRYTSRWRFRCLVALPPHRDLLLCAKHLFIAATCQLVAPDLRERHHTCLASRISMASTYGSLRQRLALRSASARLPAHSAGRRPRRPWARTCSADARRNGSRRSAGRCGSCC